MSDIKHKFWYANFKMLVYATAEIIISTPWPFVWKKYNILFSIFAEFFYSPSSPQKKLEVAIIF